MLAPAVLWEKVKIFFSSQVQARTRIYHVYAHGKRFCKVNLFEKADWVFQGTWWWMGDAKSIRVEDWGWGGKYWQINEANVHEIHICSVLRSFQDDSTGLVAELRLMNTKFQSCLLQCSGHLCSEIIEENMKTSFTGNTASVKIIL